MKKIISIPIVKYSLVLIGVFLATMLITSLITGHLKKKNNSLTTKNGLSDKNINTVSNTEISSDILVSDEEEQKELEENAEEIKSDEDKPAHVESKR